MFPINARHNLRRSSTQINTAGIAPHDHDESNNGDVDAINVASTHRGAPGGGSGRVPVPTAVQIFNVVVELAGQAEPTDLAGSIETTEKMPSIPPPKSNSRSISSTKQWRQYRPAHSTDLLRPLRLDIVTVSQGHDGHDANDDEDEDDAIRHSAAATSTHARDTTCRYSSCCVSPSINPAWEHINERMDLPDNWWAGEAGEHLYKSMRFRVKVMANLKSRLDQEDQILRATRNSDAIADVDTSIDKNAREKGQPPAFDLLDIPIHPSFLKTLDEMPESFPPNACIIHFTDRSMRCVPSLYHLLVDESVTGGDNSSSGDGAATDDMLRFEDDAFRTLDDVVKDEKAEGEDADAAAHAEAQSGATDPNREEGTTALSTAGDGTNTAGNGGGDNRKPEHEHDKDQEEGGHHRQQQQKQQQQNATISRSQLQTHDESFTPQPSSNPTSTLDQRARIHSADAMLDAAIADANEDETALMAAIAEEEAAIAKHLISIQSKKQSVQTLVTNISRTGKESTVVKREAEQHARMLGRDRVRCRSLQMKLLSDLQSIYPIRCAVGVSSQSSMNAKQRQADAVGTESGTLIPSGPNHASRSRSASGDVAVNVGVDFDGHQHTSSAANAESVDVHRMNMNMNTSMNTDGNASAGAAYTSVPKAANTVSDASMNQSGSERMPVSPVAASRSGASTSVSTKRNLHNDFIDGGNATSANASIGKTVNHEAHARDGQLASHHHDDNDHVHIHTSANESGAYIIPTIRGLRTPPRSNHAAVANSGRAAYSHSTGVMDNAQTLGQMPPPPSSSAAAAAAAAATKKAAITTKTGTKSTATSTASTAAASTPISDEEASAALGFTCHAILLVSKYLSVPLRHRIIHNSSRSGIMVDKGTMLPLFVARSVNRDELDEALSLLHSNVDTIASSRGINVFGDWHILEKLNVIIGHELRML